MELSELQQRVDAWIRQYGVRYFSELTNMTVLTEEVGELARIMARKYGDQSFKAGEKDWIGHYPAFALFGLILVGFGALMAMAGPIGFGLALPRAFGLGALVAGLIGLTALRWGEAEDLGGPAVFLASEASDFVNGLILYVDGGILAYIGKQPQ